MAVLLLAAAACRGADDLDRAAAMLVPPPGGHVEIPPGIADRLDRVSTAVCYAGRSGATLAAPLRADLEAAGWRDVVVEPHPTLRSRWSVRATADRLALAGLVEETPPACAGARLSLSTLVVPPGASRTTAGAPGYRPRITP
jgi:hypothetical protein